MQKTCANGSVNFEVPPAVRNDVVLFSMKRVITSLSMSLTIWLTGVTVKIVKIRGNMVIFDKRIVHLTSQFPMLGHEVFVMRCIVHIRKSFDLTGEHFVLRLCPLDLEGRRSKESFSSAALLSQRLLDVGLPKMHMQTTFSNLRNGLDAIWSNVEVGQETFINFGKMTRTGSHNCAPIAA